MDTFLSPPWWGYQLPTVTSQEIPMSGGPGTPWEDDTEGSLHAPLLGDAPSERIWWMDRLATGWLRWGGMAGMNEELSLSLSIITSLVETWEPEGHYWDHTGVSNESFIAKRVMSILVNLRYLRFKLLKFKENNKKSCNIFYHNFKNIPLYIMRKVSLESIIKCIIRWCPYFKMS